ncbi:MAG: flagellar basal body-associated FliL family protein [Bacillota bacterium]
MAEKAEKKAEEKAPAPAPPAAHAPAGQGTEGKKASGGLLKSTPVLLGVVMVLEAGIIFAGFKMLGVGAAPASAQLATQEEKGEGAAEGGHGGGHGAAGSGGKVDPKKAVELKVLEFKAPNKQSGRTYLYDLAIYIRIKGENKAKVEPLITERDALIKDRIRTIVGQSDPEKLGGSEPGLETLRRQVRHQLEEILGEGLVEEVLVPRCIPYRADY